MDRGAWWAAVCGMAESQTWPRDWAQHSVTRGFGSGGGWEGEVHTHRHTHTLVYVSSELVAQLYPTLWPHGLQHARLPCPLPTPRAASDSCPSSRWCHPTILSSVVPFSSRLQSFPASRSFPISQFFPSGDQSTGVSASASVLPMNIQGWFPLR